MGGKGGVKQESPLVCHRDNVRETVSSLPLPDRPPPRPPPGPPSLSPPQPSTSTNKHQQPLSNQNELAFLGA